MKKYTIGTTALFLMLLAIVLVAASPLSVKISPTRAVGGNNINISVSPPPQGIYAAAYIYRSPNYYSGYVMLNCTTYMCHNPVNATYYVPASWVSGEYYLAMWDYSETNYSNWMKKFYFNVTGGVVSRNLTVKFAPRPAVVGSNLSIQIFPGSEGIERYIYIYSATNYRYKAYFYLTTAMCPTGKSSYCYNPINISYFIPNSAGWVNGPYQVMISDISESNINIYYRWKNFTFNLTGGIMPRNMSVTLKPTTVQAGKSINVSLIPSTEGTMTYAYIYKNRYGGIYKNYTYFSCGSNTTTWGLCYNPSNFTVNIPSWWVSDEYYLAMYDYSKSWSDPAIWRKVYFNVTGGAQLKNLSVAMNTSLAMGQNLNVQITPGSEGIITYVYFYTAAGRYVYYQSLWQGCRNWPCYTPVNFSRPISSPMFGPGQYKMMIYDYNVNGYKDFYFTVENSCISNQLQYDACANDDSKVVVDSPSCSPFTKFINEQCTAYGNFTCVDNKDVFCWSTHDSKPIGTSNCVTNWACPQEQTPYADNASCIASLGTPVQKLGCLSNVTCKFYQSVSQACRDFRIGDCINSDGQLDKCSQLGGRTTPDQTCSGYEDYGLIGCIGDTVTEVACANVYCSTVRADTITCGYAGGRGCFTPYQFQQRCVAQ